MRWPKIILSSAVISFVVLVLFTYLQPKIGASLYPAKRQMLLNQFTQETQKNQDIDLNSYWEFREFYSPGSFAYEKKGLSKDTNSEVTSLMKLDPTSIPQQLFSSQKIISAGGRTKSKTLPSVNTPDKHILVKTPSVFLSENDVAFSLVFLKPISEVKKANGFLQNEPTTDDQGNMWVEITTIQK